MKLYKSFSYHVYIRLSHGFGLYLKEIENNPTFKGIMKQIYSLLFLLFPLSALAQPGNFIHIDQFGYQTQAEKVAVISNPQTGYNSSLSFSPSNTLYVKNAATNQTVFSDTVQIWDNGNTHTNSGDKGWWFDFSALQTNGEFYIVDTINNERSHTFSISSNPYYELLKHTGRMFFYNRCNYAKNIPYANAKWADGMNFMNTNQDGDCHLIHDTNNIAPVRNLSGGWFDAGDYNKYVTFAYSAVHNMLNAYEENPTAFGDDWNIPESGNGIPDIIDEIKWETDWLLRMVDSNGLTPIKMGSQNYSQNSSYPPSNNTDPRFYGPNCTSSSIAAASMLSHAGIVMKQFPSLTAYIDSLSFKAKVAADYARPLYFSNGLQYDCDDGSIISGDADVDSSTQVDMLMTASVYLWELINDTLSKNFIDFNYYTLGAYINYDWSAYNSPLMDALLRYANLSNAGPNAANNIKTNIAQAVSSNWSGYFGWNETDLYRAPVPDWTYHWGSNQIIARYGNMNNLLAENQIAFDSINQKRRAAQTLHYFHGINPNGLTYLSNLYDIGADKCIDEIYHAWFADGSIYDNAKTSSNGPAPGYLVGGANQYFSYTALAPPYGQPRQKSYLDFNTGWPQNSWEVSEPAIYYQAAYLRLLSKYVTEFAFPTSTNKHIKKKFSIYPNPTINKIFIKGITGNAEAALYDFSGRLIYTKKVNSYLNSIDLGEYPIGLYLLKIKTEDAIQEIKLIKK